MADRTDRSWEEWGRRDPYYGVLGLDQFRGDRIAGHRDEFFASGEQSVERMLRDLAAAHGGGRCGNALDFGAGVGRLTLPLARRFARVVGIDIAASMRAEAQRNATLADCHNIEWRATLDVVSPDSERFDLIVSYIVFQHIPVVRGMVILDQLLALLAPGGRLWIHLSVKRYQSLRERIGYWAWQFFPPARYLMNLARGYAYDMPPMQMNEYPLADVLRLFARHGLHDIRLSTEFHGRVMTVALRAAKDDGAPAPVR